MPLFHDSHTNTHLPPPRATATPIEGLCTTNFRSIAKRFNSIFFLTAAPGIPRLTPLTSCSSSSRAVLGTQLDPVRLIVDVEDALLDLVEDLSGGVDEGLLNIGRSLGRGFHEN